MDFLGFTLSVWAAIAFGVFFIAMVVACTTDRYGNESPKWVVLVLGALLFGFMYWGDLSWRVLMTAPFWKWVGIYLGIGLAYSVLEFLLTIRKEERRWSEEWARFKKNAADAESRAAEDEPSNQNFPLNRGNAKAKVDTTTLEERFVSNATNYRSEHQIVKVELDKEGKVAPVINRGELAENVGCWTTFWPAYAVSLVIGDLFNEVCRKFADAIASLSGRLVRRAFSKTFTP